MISIKNLQKHYTLNKNSISILKDINLTLVPGEMTCLVGESGCGKSTFLHILGGLDDYDAGEYLFNGKDVENFSEKEWSSFRTRNIGFIFQSFNLIPHLSALENVEISMTLNKVPKGERRKRAKSLLDSVGLKNRYEYLPSQLSGGQKQRVAIARALANDPDIILADEPTGALDSKNSKQVMTILKTIAEKGKIVLVVTHSLELSKLGDTIIEMKDGRIECIRRSQVKKKNSSSQGAVSSAKRNKINWLTTLKLSLKNIRSKKWRNFLTSLGASIGIFGIAIIAALGNGIHNKVSSTIHDESSKLKITVHNKDFALLSIKDFDKLKSLSGVQAVYPSNSYQISIKAGSHLATGNGESLLPKKYQHTYGSRFIESGHYPAQKDEIAVPERIAKSLFKDPDQAIGRTVTLTAQLMSGKQVFQTVSAKAKITGLLKNQSVSYLDSIGVSDNLSAEMMKTIASGKNRSLSCVIIPASMNKISGIKKAAEKEGYVAQTNNEIESQLNTYVSIASTALAMLSGISLLVSSIMIGIVLYMGVVERTKEIGILKSLGAYKTDIKRIFMTEGTVIGLLGGLLGALIAVIVGVISDHVIEDFIHKIDFPLFQYSFLQIVCFVILSGFLGMMASLIPASLAARQKAVEALKYE